MPIDSNAGCNFDIPIQNCTISTCCLAQGAAYNYLPHYGGNMIFLVFFALFTLPQLWFGVRHKTWGFMIGMIHGVVLEAVGYYARLGLHDDPFSDAAFLISLVGLTIALVFVTAAIYLCLSRMIGLYGQHLSYLKPRILALTFMTSDLVSLILQAVGGVLAKTATSNLEDPQPGINAMISGLLLQAVSLGFFAAVWAAFMLRVRSGIPDQSAEKRRVRERPFFTAFMIALALSTLVIEIRSIYRVVELWGGLKGELWNDEGDFTILDGVMMGIAVLSPTAFHPGTAFAGQWNTVNWSLRGEKHNTKPRGHGLGPEREMHELWRRGGREILITSSPSAIEQLYRNNKKTQPDLTKTYDQRTDLFASRIFIPKTASSSDQHQQFPLIIDVHGGGFILNNPSFDDPLARYLADTADCVVVSVDYRKAPQSKFPIAYNDIVEQALAIINDHELPVDSTRVVLCGSSAGGNLVLAASQHPDLRPKLRGVLGLYPLVDVGPSATDKMATRPDPSAPDFLGNSYDNVAALYLDQAEKPTPADVRLSPTYFFERTDLPKNVLLIGCEHDLLCREAEVMAEKLGGGLPKARTKYGWKANGVEWHKVIGQAHAFEHFQAKSAEKEKERLAAKDATYDTMAGWLKKILGRT